MILLSPQKTAYDFSGKISPDTLNTGFSDEEMKKIYDSPAHDSEAKGFEWKFWEKQRTLPSEIENLKSEFGYQSNPYLINLADVAKEQGTPLEGQIKTLSNNFNFFVMPCGFYIAPKEGEKFEALKFEVQYKHTGVATYSMFPGPKLKKVFEVGAQVELGVNGKAEFSLPEIPLLNAQTDASAKAALDAKFILSFNYEYKTREIDAFGTNNSFCTWLMYKGSDLRNDVTFYPVIRAPKSVSKFDCVFKAHFKIGKNWKRSALFQKEQIKNTVST